MKSEVKVNSRKNSDGGTSMSISKRKLNHPVTNKAEREELAAQNRLDVFGWAVSQAEAIGVSGEIGNGETFELVACVEYIARKKGKSHKDFNDPFLVMAQEYISSKGGNPENILQMPSDIGHGEGFSHVMFNMMLKH